MAAAPTVDLPSLLGGKLTLHGADVDVASLQGKVVALYFSAHFTPLLISSYKAAIAAGQPFELVYVSSDHDEEGFEEYTKGMPWPCIKFEDEDARQSIKSDFGVKTIPHLAVVSPSGELVAKDGRSVVAKEKEAAIQRWCEEHAAKKAEAFTTEAEF